MRVIDCFIFFNELDLLEFRLKFLDSAVDLFVIVESDKTHTGKEKTYYFEQQKNRFQPWIHKIHYIKLSQSIVGLDFEKQETNYNPTGAAFIMENAHRNGIEQIFPEIVPTDLVLLSDLDEIPDPKIIRELDVCKGPQAFSMLFHYYFMNCRNIGSEKWWRGSIACSGETFKKHKPQYFRDQRDTFPGIPHAGWHFSYLGGLEQIKKKIQSIAHTEFNRPEYLQEEKILEAMEKGNDIFNRPGLLYSFMPLSFYPKRLRKVMLAYPQFLHGAKVKDHLFNKIYYSFKRLLFNR